MKIIITSTDTIWETIKRRITEKEAELEKVVNSIVAPFLILSNHVTGHYLVPALLIGVMI